MSTDICNRCHGLGMCPTCKGSGKVITPQIDGLGTAYRRVRCEACVGTGMVETLNRLMEHPWPPSQSYRLGA